MKKLISKIALFLAILIIAQWGVVPVLYRLIPVYRNHPAHRLKYRIDNLARRKIQILLFGDSVFGWAAAGDSDKRTINQMIADSLSDFAVGTLDHPAYQLDMFDAYCTYAVEQKYRFPVVAFEVNLSTFQPFFDRFPAFQFDETKMILRNEYLYHALFRPLMVFHYSFASVSDDDFYATPVYFGDSLAGHVREFETIRNSSFTSENLEQAIVYRYLGNVSKEHRKIQHAVHAAGLLKAAGMAPVFFIFPIDYQTGESIFPGVFLEIIKRHVSIFSQEVEAAGGMVVDLSTLLSEDKFDWKGINYIEEHLKQDGRLAVADTIARILLPIAQSAPKPQ